jgi:hypothetical protein
MGGRAVAFPLMAVVPGRGKQSVCHVRLASKMAAPGQAGRPTNRIANHKLSESETKRGCRVFGDDPAPRCAPPGAADHTIESGAAAAAPAPNPNFGSGDGGQQAAPAGRSVRGSVLTELGVSARPSRTRAGNKRHKGKRALPPKLPEFQCRVFGDDPVPRCARPAPPTTPSNPAPRRPHQPPTRIQEVATAASRRPQRVGPQRSTRSRLLPFPQL